jgi:hypothetical protein
VPEGRAAVQANAGDAGHGELHGQHIALLARRVVARRAVHGADRAVGEGLGVEPGGGFGIAVEPQADGVLALHGVSPQNQHLGTKAAQFP